MPVKEFQRVLSGHLIISKNTQEGMRNLESICCLSIKITKHRQSFMFGVEEKSLKLKELQEWKKSEIVAMVCWDEEFIEDIQITKEILMKSKWNIKEAD